MDVARPRIREAVKQSLLKNVVLWCVVLNDWCGGHGIWAHLMPFTSHGLPHSSSNTSILRKLEIEACTMKVRGELNQKATMLKNAENMMRKIAILRLQNSKERLCNIMSTRAMNEEN